MPRLHILGPSGAGATSLGRALAAALGVGQLDSDEVLFLPTDPPYGALRPLAERRALLEARLPAGEAWVLSGCVAGWEGAVAARCTLFVLLRMDRRPRLERLRRRERARFGGRLDPGGDMAAEHRAFLRWAARYDTAGPEQRSLALHEAWLARWQAPVLRLDAGAPPAALLAAVLAHPSLSRSACSAPGMR